MWSIGLILLELHLGEPLIISHNKQDHMYKICKLFDMPTYDMIQESNIWNQFFQYDNKNNFK